MKSKILNSCRAICALTISLPGFVYAGLWPVVTSMETIVNGNSAATYRNIQWQMMDVGMSSEQVAPSGGLVTAAHKHNGPGGAGAPGAIAMWGSKSVRINAGDNIGSAARSQSLELPAFMTHNGSPNGGECVGVIFIPDVSTSWDNAIFPPGSCVYAPPGSDWCNITTPTINIDHGVLTVGSGMSSASSELEINCTAPMKIKLSFGNDIVLLSNGLKSNLTVNDTGGVINAIEGNNFARISSEVDVHKQVLTGDFNGSSVAFIEYY